jgi:peptidylprolyl isomerase
MMRLISLSLISIALTLSQTLAFSVGDNSRRAFLAQTAGSAAALLGAQNSVAAPEVITTPSGIKYVVTKPPKEAPKSIKGDIIAIEYTGYLPNGQIFDATHAEGKKNALMFELGGNAVIDGINEMVANMGVGEKRQVIVPASLAFKDKGICVEREGGADECLIKPGQTLVYDISLKRTSIPPP